MSEIYTVVWYVNVYWNSSIILLLIIWQYYNLFKKISKQLRISAIDMHSFISLN